MREAERLCDRLAIIHRGRILTAGSLDDLRNRYQEPDLEELFFGLIQQEEKDGETERRRDGEKPAPAFLRYRSPLSLSLCRSVSRSFLNPEP